MDALHALADPTRRHMIELLSEGERTAGELGEAFPISQPAVSRHLRVLREVGLVTSTVDAQRRIYRLAPDPFDELADWVDDIRQTWTNRLDALGTELQRGARAARKDTA
ncbi:MAG: metalloregulator ArsR/SmtB family transcription factor [Acidimicrobiales bacterium]|nr:metalloregulator ArsR/SmtB family transcription factor [Acidimicrobiales bacterium]